MSVVYARFNETTRDFAGQTITSNESGGLPTKPGFIYKALQEKLENPNDMMLGEDGDIITKPIFPSFDKLTIDADGTDEATITNLPLGTQVRVSGPAGEVIDVIGSSDNGELFVSSDVPGTIFVALKAVNHISKEVEITAT